MYKSIIIVFAFILSISTVTSQDKRDIGLQLGGTYYYGDFNEIKPLFQPSFSLGVLFRYNLNSYYSIRASALYGNISGSYTADRYLPLISATSFSKSYIGAEIMGEFNFMSLNPINVRKGKFSPFVNIGIGVSQIGGTISPNIPFGFGVKFTPGQRHTIALEWRFHKTFTDEIDNYVSPDDGRSVFIHNSDWISYIGLNYTYRLFNNNNLCPVYK